MNEKDNPGEAPDGDSKATPPPLPRVRPALPGAGTRKRPVFPRVGKSTPPPLPPSADGPALDESQAAHLTDLLALVGEGTQGAHLEPSDEVPTLEVPKEEEGTAAKDTSLDELDAAARGASLATDSSQLAHLDELLAVVTESAAGRDEPTTVEEEARALAAPPPARPRIASETELAHFDDLLAAVGQTMDSPGETVGAAPPPKPPRQSKPIDESLVAPVGELLEAATQALGQDDEPEPSAPADEVTPPPTPATAPPTDSLVVHVDELLAAVSKSLDDE